MSLKGKTTPMILQTASEQSISFRCSSYPFSSNLQASTGELLRCLSDFLRHRCVKLKEFPSNQIIIWFRNVDRALLLQGWQVSVHVLVLHVTPEPETDHFSWPECFGLTLIDFFFKTG
ncbi:hypothetical protein CHARACLAT_032654 [Characodon lateralis]|uniref:Uncharacterized protein n=1 Tax=Characodon lateralis TaxID=208331 RepID=A0ABU7ERZ7_9TELE|nr:hypothetical protein [Characodon lateralis]